MTDNSIITFGIHKGSKLANVPASYLIFLYNAGKCSDELREYIEDNMAVLREETSKK